MEITNTADARRALNEHYPLIPGQTERILARIVACTREEEDAFYAARTKAEEAAALSEGSEGKAEASRVAPTRSTGKATG